MAAEWRGKFPLKMVAEAAMTIEFLSAEQIWLAQRSYVTEVMAEMVLKR